MKKILVIGAGAWGCALANLLAKNSAQVFLSANKPEIIKEINTRKTNQKFLPNIKLSPKIKAIGDFTEIAKSADFIFIVVPSKSAAEIFIQISQAKIAKNCGVIICSKGFKANSFELLSESFAKITNHKNYAILSGPNFALEVAQEFSTITTIAAKNKKLAQKIISALNCKNFQAQYFNDPRTAEICGIAKNVIAIGCGICDGLNLGVNAKSALVVRGILEIEILCKKLKASTNLNNAAGFGDIFLTCSSSKSRNNLLGFMLAQEKTYPEIAQETGKTFEGASSAQSLAALAKKLKLSLDLCVAINQILTGKYSAKQIKQIITKSILN
jgi:glycerol-3-phosphate dehydrogenase (NAD(P)+)